MISPSRFGRQSPTVVCVSGSTVEALIPRRARVGSSGMTMPFRLVRFQHDLELGEDLASLIAERLLAHGARHAAVTVGIGSDLVKSATIEVPLLSPRDTEAVIGRRAAALLDGVAETTLHSGIALDGEDVDKRRWLVHACDRPSLTAFQTAMRRLAFPVRSAVPLRAAPFLSEAFVNAADRVQGVAQPGGANAGSADGASDEQQRGATLIALFEGDACHIGLISGRRLVQLTELRGSAHAHLTEEGTARAFIQELRGIDAFWRRSSRGERVAAVVLAGVESLAVDRMRPSIQGALGPVGVEPLAVPGPRGPELDPSHSAMGLEGLDGPADLAPLDDATERARGALLASLQSPRVAALDLAAPLRPRSRTLIGVTGASLVICGTMALALRGDFESRAMSIETDTRVVATRATDMGELQELSAEARRAEADLMATLTEIRSLSALGLDIEALGYGVIEALGYEVELTSISANGGSPGRPGGGVLRIRGAVADVPGETSRTLAGIEARLGRVPGIATVEIDMPSLDDRQGGASDLRFSIRVGLVNQSVAAAPASGMPRGAELR